MKRTFFVVLAAMLMVSCGNSQKNKAIDKISLQDFTGQNCIEITTKEEIDNVKDNHMQVENIYSINWPDISGFSPEIKRQLVMLAFGDSSAMTFEEASERFLASTWVDDDTFFGGITSNVKVDSIFIVPYSYVHLDGFCDQDSNLLLFTVNEERYCAYTDKTTLTTRMLTVDLATGDIVQLCDLVDTSKLGEVMLRALEDVAVNKENGNFTKYLFDDYSERLPQPDGFFIDNTRSVIVAYFNPGHVQYPICGTLEVIMPVFWLSKHIPLSEYAKELFGPDSYIE